MPNTYTLLETITVGAAGAASVTFNSIPQTGYTDLVVKVSARDTRASVYYDLGISFNGLTTNLTGKILYGDGSSAASYSVSNGNVAFDNSDTSTANTFNNLEYYIPNYTSSNFKSFSVDNVTENNATAAFTGLSAGLWSSTAAITSVTFTPLSGTLKQHSTFSLYGVSALGTTPTKAPKATGGSIIQTDGTYWYHAFLSSGTFTPAVGLTADVLVVAGGGGGGCNLAGAGGAGGLLAYTSQSLTATNYTITVGAGGARSTAAGAKGSTGSNSQFGALTAMDGGGGGGSINAGFTNGANGGSGGGGGGGYINGTGGTGGTATSGQGNNGGAGASGSSLTLLAGGGGGGAGAAGISGTGAGGSSVGGNGGTGSSSYSTWASATGTGVSGNYAGGGGGGVQNTSGAVRGTATAGGGNGGGITRGSDGTANTGGGGGGGGNSVPTDGEAGYNGGSGLVIVRYLA